MRVRGAGYLYKPKYRSADGQRKEAGVYWWKCAGKRFSTGCRTEEEAQKWALERLIDMRRGHLLGVKTKPLLWDDIERMLIDRWTLDGRKGMLQSMAVLRRLRRAFQGWQAEAITTDRITAHAARRREAGAAPATINLELAVLRRGFTLAREAGRIASIPVIHRLPATTPRTGTIEAGDLERILAELGSRYRPVVRLLYLTGWREGEALGLTWQRVDLEAGELRLDTSKTGQPRILHFPPGSGLATLLKEQHGSRKAISPYVFPGRAGRRTDRTALQKAWRRACVAAGLPKALIHDLRRTMVRDMRRAGVPLAVAMGAVGHASLQIHQGYSVVARRDQLEGLSLVEAMRAREPHQQRLLLFGR
ncbi:MAG TPA: site-specific integrase [Anaerolineae bacterium]|nr:site-specific integrase [Anaerolineae bacterium]